LTILIGKTRKVSDVGRSIGRLKGEDGTYEIPALVLPYYAPEGGNPLISSEDIVIEYLSEKYYVGGICKRVEQGMSGQSLQKEKDTIENLIINLAMLAKTGTHHADLLLNMPFNRLQEDGPKGYIFKAEKQRIKDMYQRAHDVLITYGNGRNKTPITKRLTITIDKVGFAGETEIIFFMDPTKDYDVGILEVGSRTTQGVYYIDGMVHYGRSFAQEWGWDSLTENRTPKKVANDLIKLTAQFNWP
jgi:hypothetical protein